MAKRKTSTTQTALMLLGGFFLAKTLLGKAGGAVEANISYEFGKPTMTKYQVGSYHIKLPFTITNGNPFGVHLQSFVGAIKWGDEPIINLSFYDFEIPAETTAETTIVFDFNIPMVATNILNIIEGIIGGDVSYNDGMYVCLLYTSPSPRDAS